MRFSECGVFSCWLLIVKVVIFACFEKNKGASEKLICPDFEIYINLLLFQAMTGQYLCNRQITVSYAYKKDTKGERHGTPAGWISLFLYFLCRGWRFMVKGWNP